MRNFKAFRTLNVPQKCSVKYYTNAEILKISKKIVQSVEYSPRPYIDKLCFLHSFFVVTNNKKRILEYISNNKAYLENLITRRNYPSIAIEGSILTYAEIYAIPY